MWHRLWAFSYHGTPVIFSWILDRPPCRWQIPHSGCNRSEAGFILQTNVTWLTDYPLIYASLFFQVNSAVLLQCPPLFSISSICCDFVLTGYDCIWFIWLIYCYLLTNSDSVILFFILEEEGRGTMKDPFGKIQPEVLHAICERKDALGLFALLCLCQFLCFCLRTNLSYRPLWRHLKQVEL